MAKNSKWRLKLSDWKTLFAHWINAPEPKALMHASIFFDSAPVSGNMNLYNELRDHISPLAKKNHLFLAHMVENSLSTQIPIGFFRRFVLAHDESHHDYLDIKKSGLVSIVDIIRAYSLANEVTEPGLVDRVENLKSSGLIADSDLMELLDAWHFMMTIRLKHQVEQIQNADTPDNKIDPGRLSSFEREHLRDAFSLIKTHQSGLSRALAGGHY